MPHVVVQIAGGVGAHRVERKSRVFQFALLIFEDGKRLRPHLLGVSPGPRIALHCVLQKLVGRHSGRALLLRNRQFLKPLASSVWAARYHIPNTAPPRLSVRRRTAP